MLFSSVNHITLPWTVTGFEVLVSVGDFMFFKMESVHLLDLVSSVVSLFFCLWTDFYQLMLFDSFI